MKRVRYSVRKGRVRKKPEKKELEKRGKVSYGYRDKMSNKTGINREATW